LVAAFGTPPEVIYVSARVARCADVLLDPSGEIKYVEDEIKLSAPEDRSDPTATPMVMVGCEFVERMAR
jgi:hypothetical protein